MDDKKRTLDWEDLRVFVAVARQGGYAAAARALGVNHATVARRLAALAAQLGAELFERRRDGYRLTAEGARVLGHAEAMEAGALAIADGPAQAAVRGRVRVSTLASLAQLVLLPALPEVLAAWPELDVDLLAEARNVSLALREADIALRLGRPGDSDLIGRKVGEARFGFFAAPGYDAAARLIAYDEDSQAVPEAVWMAQRFPETRRVFRSNSHLIQAEAARQGVGIAHLPLYVARAFGLAPVDFAAPHPPREVWMLTRAAALRTARVRVCCDAFAAALQALP